MALEPDQLYLEQPGCAGEGLEAGADGGEERADLDDLGVRPRDVAHHKTPPDALAEPWQREREEEVTHSMAVNREELRSYNQC